MLINNFDPVAIQIFSFEIRWYSLAYIIGILLGWILSKRIFISDNEISHLAEIDQIKLSDMLKSINDNNTLLGTGYDDMMLSNLLFTTRPESEIKDFDAAAEWVGMPDYEPSTLPKKIIVSFKNDQDREAFGKILNIPLTEKTKSVWYPHKEQDDTKNVEFTDE